MESEARCHVAPGPMESPRRRILTYAQHKARVKAWQSVAIALAGGSTPSWEMVNAAIDAYEDSLAMAHRSALDQVR